MEQRDQLGRPAQVEVDPATSELYVADGYGNRRVIVLDAATGATSGTGAPTATGRGRRSPAYDPDRRCCSSSAPRSLREAVARRPGLCLDRNNDRIQVFEETAISSPSSGSSRQPLQNGSVWDLVLSEDVAQRYIFVADGANNQIVTVDRQTGVTLTRFGRAGRDGRRVQVGAQHGDRFEGQSVHRRGRHRPPGRRNSSAWNDR